MSIDTELSDSELIARLNGGDQTAFTALVRRWEGPLVRIAYRITGDLAEAEDVRQRVLLKVLESSGAARTRTVRGVDASRRSQHRAISAIRRRKRREGLFKRLRHRTATLDESHPGARVIADDQARLLADALLCLEPDARALLALRFDLDLTFHEIAAALGQPPSTVKSRLARAISRLRTLLADHDESKRTGLAHDRKPE